MSFGGPFEGGPGSAHAGADPGGSLREALERWRSGRYLTIAASVLALIWVLSGIYIVGPGEAGVVLQFGREVAVTQPGLHYRLPWPIQGHEIVDVRTVRSAEIGYRSGARRGPSGVSSLRVPEEALMLTGDENIVEVQLFVQYIVQDPSKFIFRARDPENTLRAAAEVALRSVVGRNSIDYTMTEGRAEVQAQVREYLQGLLDDYQTGLLATAVQLLVVDAPDQVRNAFHDVVRAWEDRERLTQEAEGYREDVIPRARGEAFQIIQEAEAYREQRVLRAQGESARFLAELREYRLAPEVTRDRLYLETMERVLPGADMVILGEGGTGSEVLPLLPLRGLGTPSGQGEGGAGR